MLVKFKTRISNHHCAALVKVIEYLIEHVKDAESDQQLHMAVLAEVAKSLKLKMIDYRKDYKCSFSPAQAIALRILFTDYVAQDAGVNSDFTVALLTMSNKIHQLYHR
jgi:hypothetical protein